MANEAIEAAEAAEANDALRALRLSAERSDWAGIIADTDASDHFTIQPKILRYRLLAGTKTQDAAVIEDVVDKVIGTRMPPAEAFAIIRELGQAKYLDSAARLLLDKGELREEPHFQRAASRILSGKIKLKLRRALSEVRNVVSKGGANIKPLFSAVNFPASNLERTALGSVEIITQSDTSPDHSTRLRADREIFIRAINSHRFPQAVEHVNVFINKYGQIWNEEGAVIRPLGRPISTLDRSSVPTVDVGLSVLSATRGIYHWLVDHLPSVACAAPFGVGVSGVPILVRADAASFEAETLSYIGVDPARIIKVDDVIFVRRLVLAKPGLSTLPDWGRFRPVFEPLLRHAAAEAAREQIDLPARIYISRISAARRPLLNEAQIEALAIERGFAVYKFEELPLWHQIALVSHAKTILAPHGAGLAHLIAAPAGAHVIEILPIRAGESTYKLRWNYARLSLVRGHRYIAWLEEQSAHQDSWQVDMSEFLPFLDAQLRQAS